MNRKVEQGDATRAQLVDAGVALFTEQGFAGTSTAEIVRRAGVTRGALYHHFADKEQLFEAVHVEIQKDIFARCAAASAAAPADPAARITAGVLAFLDACMEPRVQRILLREGPSVLGWERSLRFDDPYCARRLLLSALRGAARDGLVPDGHAEPLAHALFGALNQAGNLISAAADPVAERERMGRAIADLIAALLRANPGA
ncbi:DNA-binding transcriptional regulator, AcrR family [Thermomonospora echinospora]|uniref:DNA-binding transcriptional regulator, AcrR family n=1 Tax=Thermomonospora echinospora TaxID=1992 RepID=A0A1H5XC07_9ACTN|nr:TetR/AcrR family transcriptional regulator [Thermomonospora echinospora]SEG09193.1 DNA-binding transcriptional regulator, AcrR family [Thermomonospora echinospora]